jgi:hypothetical protein
MHNLLIFAFHSYHGSLFSLAETLNLSAEDLGQQGEPVEDKNKE